VVKDLLVEGLKKIISTSVKESLEGTMEDIIAFSTRIFNFFFPFFVLIRLIRGF